MAALRALRADMTKVVDGYVEQGMDREYAESHFLPRLVDVIDDLAGDDEPAPIVPDRMPHAANSPAGPREGVSTTHEDLAVALYGVDGRGGLAGEAANHSWWQANPHWAYALHDPEEAALYLCDAA